MAASVGRRRFGGKETKKIGRKLGGMAARTLMMKLATGMSKKELSRLSKRLASLGTVNDKVENDLIEEHRFAPQEGQQCG